MKTALLLSSVSFPLAYMSDRLPVVTIVTDAGPVRINKSDYDANPDQYTLHDDEAPADKLRDDGPTIAEFVSAGYPAANYPPQGYASKSSDDEIAAAIAADKQKTEQPAQTPAPAPAPVDPAPAPAAPSLNLMKEGKKHFVVDAAGVKVEAEGIDPKGYANEQDAWNAILALPR